MEQQPPTSIKDRQALIVLGMHRSGTSAVARAANLVGFTLGQKLMPRRPDNPAGFWEPIDAVRISQRVLLQFGRDWDDPRPIYLSQFQTGRIEELRKVARQYLTSDFANAPRITLKDPRFSRLIPFWHPVFEEQGYSPRYLYVYRNPMDVAHSLKVRNGITSEHAQQLWLAHLLEALEALAGKTVAFLSYDDLLARQEAALGSALDRLGLAQGLERARLAAACAELNPELRHSATATERLLSSPDFANLVKECYISLRLASQRPELALRDAARLIDRWRDAWDVLSPARRPLFFKTAPEAEPPSVGSVEPAEEARPRAAIMHYHMFKNAGSSVDTILKKNFGERWKEREFPAGNAATNVAEVASWIQAEKDADAFSSHTAPFPLPEIDGVEILPIVFIRHPLDRIRSAYDFERKQTASTLGARLAKEHDFAGYVTKRNASPRDRQCRDFQCSRLARLIPENAGSEDERAQMGLASLPFFGLVEAFDLSIERLEAWLKPRFPSFKADYVHANASSKEKELRAKLEKIRAELSPEVYSELVRENAGDLALFRFAAKAYGFNDYPS